MELAIITSLLLSIWHSILFFRQDTRNISNIICYTINIFTYKSIRKNGENKKQKIIYFGSTNTTSL